MWVELFETYRFVPSVVIPEGWWKLAEVPVLWSVDPADPVPARVVTAPVDITILRILWLKVSATYRFVPSVVIPWAWLKLAEVPVLWSVDPIDPVPAIVVTAPVEITILRILWLPLSATYRFVPSVVISPGSLKLAEVPVLWSVAPADPVPAIVVTAPVDITIFRILRL